MGAVPHTQPAATSQFQIQERAKSEHDNTTALKADAIDVLFPFSFPKTLAGIGGPGYITAQTSVQQVAYALSDKVFSYSPESFDLDNAVKHWFAEKQENAHGKVTSVQAMQTRLGAGSGLLGYAFSKNKQQQQQLPLSIIATSGTLSTMQNALNQLSLLYSVASSPVVGHVSAVDYDFAGAKLVTDYTVAMRVARETGLGLVASSSSHEAQHMALFATLAASVLPTLHIYDGVRVARETTRVIDALDQGALGKLSASILKEQTEVSSSSSSSSSKNADEDHVTRLSHILQSLNAELGTAYSFFEYEGHANPEAVLVVFGSVEASLGTQVASVLGKSDEIKVGVIAVRLISPFSETHFLQALPKSVKRLVVLGQVEDIEAVEDVTIQSGLFSDVFSAVIMSDAWAIPPPVLDVKYARSHVWVPNDFSALLKQILKPNFSATSPISEQAEKQEEEGESLSLSSTFDLVPRDACSQYVFWDVDNSTSASAPAVLARVLAGNAAQNISYTATYDNGPQAGIIQSEIRSSKKVLEAPYHIQNADVAVVKDIKILSSYDVLATVKPAGTVLLISNVADDELEKKLPAQFRRALVNKGASLFILNPDLIGGEIENAEAVRADLAQLAFLQLIGTNNAQVITTLLNYSVSSSLFIAAQELEKTLRKVEPVKEWADADADVDADADAGANASAAYALLPAVPTSSSFTPNRAKEEQVEESFLKTAKSVGIALSFKEAFDTRSSLRPELAMKNYVVKVQSYKRLTPDYYDRNVFHIEFDISGTGLTYNIGEALGVHAHNDTADVTEFISWYGLDPDSVVEVPSREDPENELEARTVFQALTQNIDIFGRPPKKFYEGLAEFATDTEEKKVLLTLSSAEGATEFKRRAEVDNVTYVDVLKEFPSAHPQFYDLVKIVSPLKRREYSIASAQIVNPTSVHLLIVEVNWVDSKGRDRFGQATHYLSRLPIGSDVTVSVKPSVMKLPPSSTAPLIMAGLGTGLAPFRAFCQYRAWQKSQGMPIGPIMLYMGSRHQREEYLYGEEWEAYTAAGIITHLGCAFSRDQKEKIYIQDRMRQSKDAIIQHFVREEGAFYLCGPTWPVPDVAAVLVEAIAEEAKERGVKINARNKLEELKDHERYILEVY